MRRKTWLGLLLAAAVLPGFLQSVTKLERSHREEGRQQLERAVRRTAVACYAAEGSYPPSVAYMQEHYGLQYDRETYVIHYEIFASNLMPDITVLENDYDETGIQTHRPAGDDGLCAVFRLRTAGAADRSANLPESGTAG